MHAMKEKKIERDKKYSKKGIFNNFPLWVNCIFYILLLENLYIDVVIAIFSEDFTLWKALC